MKQTDAIALIPARYASTRFPGKPLAKLGGESVIRRVCRQVEKAGIRPVVATDDERILREVEEGGYKAVMTSSTHCSGTDRICEALRLLEAEEGRAKGVVLNVQGDEPFIRPEQLRSLIDVFSDPEVKIATLVRRYEKERGIEGLEDPNLVKVSVRANGDALTFSRSVLPHIRGEERKEWPECYDYLTHIGVYAFRPEVLLHVASLPQTKLEQAESLEQLRWLDAGYEIRTVVSEFSTVGIDTPEDLAAAEAALCRMKDF